MEKKINNYSFYLNCVWFMLETGNLTNTFLEKNGINCWKLGRTNTKQLSNIMNEFNNKLIKFVRNYNGTNK